MQGFLSKFEENLLSEISQIKEVVLSFKTSKFNLEYLLKLDFLKIFDLKINTHYEINLSKQEILKEEIFKTKNSKNETQIF